MLTSVQFRKDSTMNSPAAHPAMPVPLATRAAASLGHVWRALVDAARALRVGIGAPDRNVLEREALAGLDERMLKDIGASEWLVAATATRARDDLQARIDGGLG
jgi:hypothetical protein